MNPVISFHAYQNFLNQVSRTQQDFCRVISMAESKPNPAISPSGKKDAKSPNIIERAKEGNEGLLHTPHHHKETHGTSDDINENTSVDEIKGPGVFERVKEEFEAIIEAFHPKKKKNEDHKHSPSEEIK